MRSVSCHWVQLLFPNITSYLFLINCGFQNCVINKCLKMSHLTIKSGSVLRGARTRILQRWTIVQLFMSTCVTRVFCAVREVVANHNGLLLTPSIGILVSIYEVYILCGFLLTPSIITFVSIYKAYVFIKQLSELVSIHIKSTIKITDVSRCSRGKSRFYQWPHQ